MRKPSSHIDVFSTRKPHSYGDDDRWRHFVPGLFRIYKPLPAVRLCNVFQDTSAILSGVFKGLWIMRSAIALCLDSSRCFRFVSFGRVSNVCQLSRWGFWLDVFLTFLCKVVNRSRGEWWISSFFIKFATGNVTWHATYLFNFGCSQIRWKS